jgi:hypothetical protein
VIAKLHVGMTSDEVEEALGKPNSSFESKLGGTSNAVFYEYETTDSIVAVTMAGGRVASVRAIGAGKTPEGETPSVGRPPKSQGEQPANGGQAPGPSGGEGQPQGSGGY